MVTSAAVGTYRMRAGSRGARRRREDRPLRCRWADPQRVGNQRPGARVAPV